MSAELLNRPHYAAATFSNGPHYGQVYGKTCTRHGADTPRNLARPQSSRGASVMNKNWMTLDYRPVINGILNKILIIVYIFF